MRLAIFCLLFITGIFVQSNLLTAQTIKEILSGQWIDVKSISLSQNSLDKNIEYIFDKYGKLTIKANGKILKKYWWKTEYFDSIKLIPWEKNSSQKIGTLKIIYYKSVPYQLIFTEYSNGQNKTTILKKYLVPYLFKAVWKNELTNVKSLIKLGVSIQTKDKNNNTLLHYAAKKNHVQFSNYLIKNKLYINSVNNKRQTPLHLAVQNGNVKVVKLLLKYPVDLDAENEDNRTPLDLSKIYKHKKIEKVLEKAGASSVNSEQITTSSIIKEEIIEDKVVIKKVKRKKKKAKPILIRDPETQEILSEITSDQGLFFEEE